MDVNFKGVKIQNAYLRVWNIELSQTRITFGLGVFASAESIDMIDSTRFDCDYDINGANPIAQAYAHVKSFPEYASAVDVLDAN
ncbi:hypothetical protein [Burkholderia orbicola]|uniref:hypothetical protein n=1 Tax=Burkholderia orbicola TaxID=2978683 RepID=UPI002FE2371B